jgi:hypothetical protein
MTERAKRVLLTGLTLVWVGLLAFQLITEPEPQRAPLTYKSGHAPPQRANQPVTLNKALLTRGRQPGFEPPKNIFATLGRQEVTHNFKEPVYQVQKRVPPRIRTTPITTVPPPEALPPPSPPSTVSAAQKAAQKASQQLGEYRFLGYLMQHGTALAFIEKKREVYIVKIGDLLDKNIEVKMIDPTHVKLVDATTAVEATIPLTQDGRAS